MLRYLSIKRKVGQEEELLEQMKDVVEKEQVRKKYCRNGTPWASWSREKKEKIAQDLAMTSWDSLKVCYVYVFLHLSFFPSQLKYPELPPKSTVYGWLSKTKANVALLPAGRPAHLQANEESVLLRAVQFQRGRGVCPRNP